MILSELVWQWKTKTSAEWQRREERDALSRAAVLFLYGLLRRGPEQSDALAGRTAARGILAEAARRSDALSGGGPL